MGTKTKAETKAPPTCEGCGEPLGAVLPLPEGAVSRCETCTEDDGPTCEDCGKAEREAGALVETKNGNGADVLRCTDCAVESGYECCASCGDWERDCEFVVDTDEFVCETCASSSRNSYFRCPSCPSGRDWYARGGRIGPDGERYCMRHSEGIYVCDRCNDPVWADDCHVSESTGSAYCEGCAPECGRPVAYRPADAEGFPTLPEHAGRAYTFGIEIEAILPAYPEDWDDREDASVTGDDGRETVSPVLTGSAGLRRAYGAVRAIERAGAESIRSGGVHVHVGTAGWSIVDLVRVFRAWASWGEDVFSGFVPGYRWKTGGWCKPLHGSDAIPEAIEEWAADKGIATAEPGSVARWAESIGGLFDDRYLSLNPCALERHGTIECRIFPSDTDPETVTTWTAMFVRFVHVARSTDPAVVRAVLDRFGTLRAGVRILAWGSARLQCWARDVSTAQAQNIPSRYSTRVECDPWGSPARITARRAARREHVRRTSTLDCEPYAPGGTSYLFPVSLCDKGPETCEPVQARCECETNEASMYRHPWALCPVHGLRECGGLGLAQWEGA